MRTDSDMRILPLYHAPCLLPDACLSNMFHQTRFVKDSRLFHSDFLWNYHYVERYPPGWSISRGHNGWTLLDFHGSIYTTCNPKSPRLSSESILSESLLLHLFSEIWFLVIVAKHTKHDKNLRHIDIGYRFSIWFTGRQQSLKRITYHNNKLDHL